MVAGGQQRPGEGAYLTNGTWTLPRNLGLFCGHFFSQTVTESYLFSSY